LPQQIPQPQPKRLGIAIDVDRLMPRARSAGNPDRTAQQPQLLCQQALKRLIRRTFFGECPYLGFKMALTVPRRDAAKPVVGRARRQPDEERYARLVPLEGI